MKSISRATTTAIVAFALASPCWAGEVRLVIDQGLVTLSTKDASPREILAEWARVGQTRILNGERVPGGLLTLELNGVPEAKALDIVLRSTAGYMAARRVVTTPTGSQYDRIMVMAVPRPAAGGPSPGVASNPTPQPFEQRGRTGGGNYQPQPSLMVDDQDEPVVQPQPQVMPQSPNATQGAAQPGMTTPLPQGTMQYPGQPSPFPFPQGQQPGVAPSPAAPRPGMTTPPPKPPGQPDGTGGQ